MFNMFSAISMPDNEAHRGPSPWRALAILLLFAALPYTCWRIYLRAVSAYLPRLPAHYLAFAGPIAEEVEDERADGQPLDPHTFAAALAPLFTEEPTLAAVRLWSPYQQLTCEITRLAPQTTHAGDDAVLPNLQANNAMIALRGRLGDADWIDGVSQIEQRQNEQGELSDDLVDAAQKGNQLLSARVQFTYKQNDVLQNAQQLDNSQHLFDQAMADMNKVLDMLTLDEGGVTQSLAGSKKVEDDLSAALAQYRAAVSVTPTLPAALAALAPAPTSRLAGLLPAAVSGRRVILPLFATGTDEQLTPAGFAEVLFYARPAEALNALTWKQYAPPAAELLLLLLLACWPWRRRQSRKVARGQRRRADAI